ncbi:ECF transporter S component [Chloroflexota bacterium]
MRKSFICFALAGIIAAASLIVALFPSSPLNSLLNWGLIATILVILTTIALFFEFEERAVGSKEIAMVSMLGAISIVLRIPFAVIPSVQPCTYLIICAGYVFGPMAGFVVGAITPLVSNFFLGQGPWTFYQMFAWGLVGISAGYARRFHFSKVGLIIFGIVWGYLFGWLANIWFWASFVYPLTLKTFIITQLSSVWFDTFHAIGNAVFLALLGPKTIAILERFRRRFNWELLPQRDTGSPA